MSDYEDGYAAAQNNQGGNYHSSKAAGALLGAGVVGAARLVPLALRLLVETIVAAPFLVLALVVTHPLDFLGSRYSTPRLLCIAAVAYGTLALLYYLKGIAIALRLRGERAGSLLLAGCVVVSVIVPALLLHWLMDYSLPTASLLVSWGVPVAFGLFTYTRYRFTQDFAPTFTLWAYRLGYRAASR
ncbi:hypothetical protein [Hymenobacter bucti]|uniref:Integral membrane protein n=1 Tax=Hymenobacter bucti TaxID=1844114 RepID=A0ABW4QZI8_9BACT